MDFSSMTSEEVFSWLVDTMNNGGEITLEMLNEILESRSIVDPVASENAVTIFYSGGEDTIANMLADTNNPNIRLIRRTEAFDFLTIEQEDCTIETIVRYAIAYSNPTMSRSEVTSAMIEALYGVSDEGTEVSEIGNGLWSKISARFAADTKGDSYSLCSNARSDRIFARDELKQLLNAIDDNKKIGGITKAELMKIDETSRFSAVKNWITTDLSDADVFVDSKGNIVGRSFKGTLLEEITADSIPEDYSGIVKNSDFIKASNEYQVYLNDAGEVIGRSYKGTALEGICEESIPSEFTYSTKYDLFTKLADDATMSERWGEAFDSLPATDKYRAKEFDYFARVANGLTEPEELASAFLNQFKAKESYKNGSGKDYCNFNIIDEAIVNLCRDHVIDGPKITAVNEWLISKKGTEFLGKLEKGGNALSTVVVTAVAAVTVYDTVSRAYEALDNGKCYEAMGIALGSCSNLAMTFFGGEALTGALLPYFAGAGMVIAGPIGAILGGVLAGVIGFTVSGLAGKGLDCLFENLGEYLETLYGNASIAVRYDPLVIDLQGNGFDILSLKNGVFFDENAEGLVEKTEWAAPEDGLLAIDLNGDGIINDGSELFGTSTTLPNGTTAQGASCKQQNLTFAKKNTS